MLQRLLDGCTWHGKLLRGIASAPKVAIVLVFFAGLFAVIVVESALRAKRVPGPKGSTRS